MTVELPISCNRDCGAGCPLITRVTEGRIVKIFDNPEKGPDITGCIRGYRAADTVYAPDRIQTPLLRTGGRGSGEFRTISWNEALERVAHELGDIKERHGGEAILTLSGSGSCRGAVHNTSLAGKRFFSQFGGCTTWGNYSCQAMDFTYPFVFGSGETGIDTATLNSSNLIILWGSNVCSTRFGASLENSIKRAREKGTEIVVIDPRNSRTVQKLATRWISIYPGTDSALMAALLFVLISEDIMDRRFIESYTAGFVTLEDYILGRTDKVEKTPEWASQICGVGAEVIKEFALLFGRAKPAALLPGFAIQRTLGGEDAVRLAVALQAVTGNIGVPGGSSGTPSWGGLSGPFFPKLPVPEIPPERTIPVYLWAETALQREIKGIYNVGVNYINQGANIRKNIQAFLQAEFICTHELFMTPTARYSDIVLPVSTYLEREDVVFPSENYLYYSAKAIDPLYESRHDYDILSSLAELLGFGNEYAQGKQAGDWLEEFYPLSDITDVTNFKATGIYDGGEHSRTGLKDFVHNPEAYPLPTPSGKIELSSRRYEENGFNRFPQYTHLDVPEGFPFRLISPHTRNRVNSQNSNIPWRQNDGAEFLELHPEDGLMLGIEDREAVRLESPDGTMTVSVKLTGNMMRGVVLLRQGTWIFQNESSEETGESVNLITSTVPTMPSYGSRTHRVWVRIKKASG